ncbi:protein serine/threonine kinase [Acanthamoeba castellanii str. Neff]|jgi:calcium/calmodulin-dependent protein kinase I|uniref:Protein serine/threonine kinase n=1 Tax=Acanthamoeba castellanii (strain ATCC 30010 / Neff) TaxID=1257118 RepID=L8GMM0_ACACF|nr:protein serine/threonine kinase [Acanthamoeba castellanii str. Neff]ELR14227.1 protein serine/threonine kinase [Acanthamoeba castellanii str. Neff]
MSEESVLNQKYEVKKELGRGAFSVVKLGVNKKTKEKVAIKVIDRSNVGKDYEKNLLMEMEILQRVHHPNIIQLHEMIEEDNKIYFAMELVTGGELFDRIVEKGSYTEEDAKVLVRKIVSAIEYLHDMNIAHRDLKPENLLVKSIADDTEVKIADFGLSKIIDEQKMMQTACGTPGYVAPEVLNAEGYDKEVDMWSIGVITYILLCGFPPFYAETVPEVFEQILKAEYDYPEEYWGEISAEGKDFINHLLVVDPKDRLTAKQALEHKWLHSKGKEKKKTKLAKFQEKMRNYVSLRKQQSKANHTELGN